MSELQFSATLSSRNLRAEFTVPEQRVLAVVGPNGAGKSTLLGVIAGLLRPDSGSVRLGGQLLCGDGVFVPAHRRRISLLLQDALLFPHMSVLGNVEFGPRSGGLSRTAATGRARQWLRAVGAAELADRRPRQLSGGQAQRVAIARALAAEPDLVLLDEPLAGLDATAAPEIRSLLGEVLGAHGATAIIVTHDLLDAISIADRIMVLEAGQIAEIGDTAAILTHPTSAFGARFAGVNMAAGTVEPDGSLRAAGMTVRGVQRLTPGRNAVAVFHPRHVTVHANAPEGSQRNVFAVTVTEISAHGETVTVTGRAGASIFSAHITAAAAAELKLAPQAPAYFAVKAHEVTVHEDS